jgi:hypothetical protein
MEAMNEPMKDKFASNLLAAPKMLSMRWMGLCGLAAMAWLALDPAQQQLVIQHLPMPPWMLPIVATLVGWATRVWPQINLLIDPPPSEVPPEAAAPESPPPATIPSANPSPANPAADDQWRAALRLVYPQLGDDKIARLASVVNLMRTKE